MSPLHTNCFFCYLAKTNLANLLDLTSPLFFVKSDAIATVGINRSLLKDVCFLPKSFLFHGSGDRMQLTLLRRFETQVYVVNCQLVLNLLYEGFSS